MENEKTKKKRNRERKKERKNANLRFEMTCCKSDSLFADL